MQIANITSIVNDAASTSTIIITCATSLGLGLFFVATKLAPAVLTIFSIIDKIHHMNWLIPHIFVTLEGNVDNYCGDLPNFIRVLNEFIRVIEEWKSDIWGTDIDKAPEVCKKAAELFDDLVRCLTDLRDRLKEIKDQGGFVAENQARYIRYTFWPMKDLLQNIINQLLRVAISPKWQFLVVTSPSFIHDQ